MNYTFLADLHKEFAPPEDGILSRILHKDEKVNVTLFGFSPRRPPSFTFWMEKLKSSWERIRLTPSQAHLSTCPRCWLTVSRQNLLSGCCSFR
jgi:hypothetical protein